ncbi:MAG TPA: type II toxin-antitoxin system VapC family toxin [Solirubrobacteraceae bacterium]|nr:type II toxin-antitoxin system VapC family toxin [Solirubrobacteraceae bacterium]
MPVADASVLVEYLIDGPGAVEAAHGLHGDGEEVWAPHVIDAEVGHAIRGHAASGRLSASEGLIALEGMAALPLERAGHLPFLSRAWELRQNLSFYDALYVALAEELEMPLVTFDRRLARAPGVRATIELLG